MLDKFLLSTTFILLGVNYFLLYMRGRLHEGGRFVESLQWKVLFLSRVEQTTWRAEAFGKWLKDEKWLELYSIKNCLRPMEDFVKDLAWAQESLEDIAKQLEEVADEQNTGPKNNA